MSWFKKNRKIIILIIIILLPIVNLFIGVLVLIIGLIIKRRKETSPGEAQKRVFEFAEKHPELLGKMVEIAREIEKEE